jgi:hypothetical protein
MKNHQPSTITVQYRFRFGGGKEEIFPLKLDEASMKAMDQAPLDPPGWTALDFQQCPNCPLDAKKSPRCPAALNMIQVVARFNKLLSHDKALVIVVTGERMLYSQTTIQRGVGSLMGLLMACSDCPLTAFFKPMARFHLPFASTEETIWRATSSYLLAQYFLKLEGKAPDIHFKGLSAIYQEIQKVNFAFAQRLREACEQDSMVNAIILLDLFAKSMPWAIEESLEEIRHLFQPYLSQMRPLKSNGV